MAKHFDLQSNYQPAGDQPKAIEQLVKGIGAGLASQTLLGVTGSGKTFTMANVVQQLQRPTIVMAHNKTLAAQLYGEFKEFFPNNAVEYFVSYYDYYQPEAYVPSSDTFIEKDAQVNDHIEQMRLSATKALLERPDCLVVSTVSSIYGLGDPQSYFKMIMHLSRGEIIDQRGILRQLAELQYTRNDIDFKRGTYRVRGDVIDVFPADSDALALRVELFDEELLQDSYKNFQIKTLKPFKIKKSLTDALNQLTSITKNILNKKEFPLILGGEHSITPGIIKAFSQKYKKITILQIDAHADLRDGYEGEKFSHASAMRRCLDFKNIEIVSFGIRNLCCDEYKYYKSISKRMKIFWGKDMGNWNLNTLKKMIKNKNVYITFDLDGFDSSLMSATGTPEPGGLFWNDAMRILKITSENSNIVGADINELAPKKNLHACDFIAAKLAYKILSYKFRK